MSCLRNDCIFDVLCFVQNFCTVKSISEQLNKQGAFDSAKNHKRQRRKRQSVTAK